MKSDNSKPARQQAEPWRRRTACRTPLPPGRRHHGKIRAVRAPAAAGFTLAEVLASLVFLAIVVPVSIGALQVASRSGEFADRRSAAARIADRILNETVATTDNSSAFQQQGTVVEAGRSFRWTLQRNPWPVPLTSSNSLQVLTVDVAFSVQGRDYDLRLNTLTTGP